LRAGGGGLGFALPDALARNHRTFTHPPKESSMIRRTRILGLAVCLAAASASTPRTADAAPTVTSVAGTVCAIVNYSSGWSRVNLNTRTDCSGVTTQIYLCSKSAAGIASCGVHGDDYADAEYNALVLGLRAHIEAHLSAGLTYWSDTNTTTAVAFYNT
jgi:hypothetical protein